MPREREGYRDCLADLLEYFGNRRLVYPGELAAYFGCDYRTVKKRFNVTKQGATLPMIAREMCK